MDNREIELSKYRMEQAEQCIRSAKTLLEQEDYRGSANRAYYAIFHAMRSVLALDKVDYSKHSGVSSYFRKVYIKSGIFDVEMSDIIRLAFDARSGSDYDDFFIISKEEVQKQIVNAEVFAERIKDYLAHERWDLG